MANVVCHIANSVAIYAHPTPPLATVQAALDELAAAMAATMDGGRSAFAIKNNKRKALVILVRQLAAYVSATCQGDFGKLLASGFPYHKPVRQRIGVLPRPATPSLTRGVRHGVLIGHANPIYGAKLFHWRLKANTPNAVPLKGHSTATYYAFTGLTPGVIYILDVNVKGTEGASDWSSPVSLMAV